MVGLLIVLFLAIGLMKQKKNKNDKYQSDERFVDKLYAKT